MGILIVSKEEDLIINTLNEKGYDPIFEAEFYKLRTLKLKLDKTPVDAPEFVEMHESFIEQERAFEERFFRLNS